MIAFVYYAAPAPGMPLNGDESMHLVFAENREAADLLYTEQAGTGQPGNEVQCAEIDVPIVAAHDPDWIHLIRG